MANAAGLLKESIWRDIDWRRLPRSAQATYGQLLSQKELDRAGMLPLHVSHWAKGCEEVTEAALWADLRLLEARRFIFIDEDTDELFVRSYMRHSEVTKYPQYLKAALRCAGMVASPQLRHELAVELRRLHRAEAMKRADEIDPGETVPEPSAHPAVTVPEPSPNGAITVNPSGTVPEPWGVGEGVGEGTSVVGHLGEARAREPEPNRPPEPPDDPPRYCRHHMPDGTDEKCGACGAAKERRHRILAERSAAASEAARRRIRAEAEVKLDAVAACTLCDDDGYSIDGCGLVCDHIDRAQTARTGAAKVREALTKRGES